MVSTEERKVKQRYSYRTRQGVQINNPHKTNQDSLVIKTNLADRGMNFYAVADGHGAFGHHASQYLVKNVSKLMESELKSSNLYESIPKVFHKLQNNLTDSDINVTCSGSTFVGVFVDKDEIICCNVGDSRAILARQSKDLSIQLTEKVGNSSTFPRTINLQSRPRKRGFSSMVEGFICLLYTSPSPRDQRGSRMPSSA